MLNTLYGWYLKEELSCVFDTLTFTEEIKANTAQKFDIYNARDGETKKLKLGTFNFIITRVFSASTGGIPIEVEVLPDGDLLNGFVSIVLAQREIEPTAPVVLTMDLQLDVTNNTGVDTDLFMVFEGFWIPRSLMPRFNELVDMVVTSRAGMVTPAGGGAPVYTDGGPIGDSTPVPYCEPRRF